jgi:deoxyribonuclease V
MAINLHHTHSWDLTPAEARHLQDSLRELVRVQPLPEEGISTVCAVDASYAQDRLRAAAVAVNYHTLALLDRAVVEQPLTFPYIPGLLSFREAPALLAALEQLKGTPDLLLVDGHGLAHPRRFGIACHMGVLLDLPAIGVAKSLLVGQVGDLDERAGSVAELVEGEQVLGAALRTRRSVRPVYLSVGHRVDLPSAIRVVLNCTGKYRLPEPCRQAHRLASRIS